MVRSRNAHFIDHFRDQAVRHAMGAARAVMGADIGQRFGPLDKQRVSISVVSCHHSSAPLILLTSKRVASQRSRG